MMTESETLVTGIQAMINTLGLDDTERFAAAVSRDRLNCTERRRHCQPPMRLELKAEQQIRLHLALDPLNDTRQNEPRREHSHYDLFAG